MEVRITKRIKLYECHNDKCTNYHYLLCGRIYNDEKRRYRKFKFVISIDASEMCDFLDIDTYTQKDILNYVNEIAFCCFTDNIVNYDDCKYFYELCNESIERYNKLFGYN